MLKKKHFLSWKFQNGYNKSFLVKLLEWKAFVFSFRMWKKKLFDCKTNQCHCLVSTCKSIWYRYNDCVVTKEKKNDNYEKANAFCEKWKKQIPLRCTRARSVMCIFNSSNSSVDTLRISAQSLSKSSFEVCVDVTVNLSKWIDKKKKNVHKLKVCFFFRFFYFPGYFAMFVKSFIPNHVFAFQRSRYTVQVTAMIQTLEQTFR